MKNKKELSEEQLEQVQGGRATSQAPGDPADAGSVFWGNLSGDIRPEPTPPGRLDHRQMDTDTVE